MELAKQQWTRLAREAVAFLPDVVVLFKDVLTDPRVPRGAKIKVAGALAYIVSPIDLVTDWIPGVGLLDDVAIVALAAHELLEGAGEDVVREHWRGTEQGLDLLLKLVATEFRPRKLLRRLVTEQIFGLHGRPGRGDGTVIDGEIVDRAPARRSR
jgi:uncharacterized membrane protein YkvA (DUF1232 family)